MKPLLDDATREIRCTVPDTYDEAHTAQCLQAPEHTGGTWSLDDELESDSADDWQDNFGAESPVTLSVSYLDTICEGVPGPPPNWNANRIAFEATLTNPSGGIAVPQSWIDDRASYSDDEFKGWVAYVYETNGYELDATGETLRDIYLAGPGA